MSHDEIVELWNAVQARVRDKGRGVVIDPPRVWLYEASFTSAGDVYRVRCDQGGMVEVTRYSREPGMADRETSIRMYAGDAGLLAGRLRDACGAYRATIES